MFSSPLHREVSLSPTQIKRNSRSTLRHRVRLAVPRLGPRSTLRVNLLDRERIAKTVPQRRPPDPSVSAVANQATNRSPALSSGIREPWEKSPCLRTAKMGKAPMPKLHPPQPRVPEQGKLRQCLNPTQATTLSTRLNVRSVKRLNQNLPRCPMRLRKSPHVARAREMCLKHRLAPRKLDRLQGRVKMTSQVSRAELKSHRARRQRRRQLPKRLLTQRPQACSPL